MSAHTLTHACVVVGAEDAISARLLLDDLRAVEPELELVVLALPGARATLQGEAGVVLLGLDDIGLSRDSVAAIRLSTAALARAARPLLVEQLLRDGAGGVVLLPADCEVRGRLTALRAGLEEHVAVVVPRLCGRLPDDAERPDGADLDAAGLIDDAFVAVRPGAERVVRYWAGRCAPDAGAGPSPLTAAVRAFDGVMTLEDPGYDVSAWNLHERPLTTSDDDGLLAGGAPVVVIRFEGFRPDRPWWYSEDATRPVVLDDPVLSSLCRDRAERMRTAGWVPPSARPTGPTFAALVRGDERLTELHGEAVEDGEAFGDLDEPGSAEAFIGWLEGPAPVGRDAGLTRYAHHVWRARPDVRDAYPDLDGADGPEFVGWLWVHGLPELKLDPRFLPEPPSWYEGSHADAPSVEVFGYLRAALGLGEAARGYVRALRAADVRVATHSVPVDGPPDRRGDATRRQDEVPFEDAALDHRSDVVLACVNAPQLPELMEQLEPGEFDGRYLIGQWGWEVDVVPPWWEQGFDKVDELWVYSTFVADNLSKVSPVPVVAVPLPVEAPDEVAATLPVALPEAPFTFLFAFDFLSTLERKNPVGLIEAFKQAFAPGEGPVLILKTTNARFRKQERDRLRHHIGDRGDIAILDADFSRAEIAGLFARADCYVSLHRSEGFGLTLAESMIQGKPVVATRFGGNTDFMTPANSYLIEYEPVAVGPDAEHYPAEGTWAEPSIEHAAHVLREIWADRDAAAQRGAQARKDIEANLSAEAVGAIARARLQRIARNVLLRPAVADETTPWPIGELEHRLEFDLGSGAGSTGPRGVARRAMLRAIRPYTVQERQLDRAMTVAMRRLAMELAEVRAARERDRARIARLERRLRER